MLFGAFWFFFLVAEGNAAPYFGLILLEHLCSPHWIAIERCSRRLPRPRPDPYLHPTFAPMWTRSRFVKTAFSLPPSSSLIHFWSDLPLGLEGISGLRKTLMDNFKLFTSYQIGRAHV